ncbi:MAG: 16S rRNA (guanine(966)-N(2))-methyltransferase RsmD [Actinobacteria bacterium]|nr:16S rRNA (guanine(966)-N(2))-methyltransferase RsmD [Actinomycetota bacterium]
MRVIAGTAKGHHLEAPPGKGTRPTSDRVREALFSSLQPRLQGAHVIDLYAGSGALGIEALSRGADVVTFVERSKPVQRVIRQNLDHTGFADRADVLVRDVRQALRDGPPGAPFDIALLDPPYATDRHELEEVLELLVPLLAPDAIVVLERPTRSSAPTWPAGLNPGRVRRYGDTSLHEAIRATPPVERNEL